VGVNVLAMVGVALGLFAEDPGWSYRALLDEIRATGAGSVELVVAWYQEDGAATELGDHPRYTASDEAVARTIREAHAAGLRVLLFPIVRLRAPREGEWRGTLRPRDRDAWFRSYRGKLLALAKLAKRERVEELSIGSELSTLDGDRARWAPIVSDVRKLFPGRLTYSGNWDHFRDVAIYDLVDELGLCGYFPLAGVTVEELVRAWRDLRDELARFARKQGRPLLFTELGYLSQRGSSAWPWDEAARAPIDLEEQRRAYEAFRRVWQGAPPDAFAGVYFWNWYGWGGPTSRGYTPRGKPAAAEIRAWPSVGERKVGAR
jgi:hypothetical protein